jgi:hypothetical protein
MNKVESHISSQLTDLSRPLLAPNRVGRRSFLRRLGLGAALLAPGAAFLSRPRKAFGNHDEITHGDAAILRFLAAAEIIETDLGNNIRSLGESMRCLPAT